MKKSEPLNYSQQKDYSQQKNDRTNSHQKNETEKSKSSKLDIENRHNHLARYNRTDLALRRRKPESTLKNHTAEIKTTKIQPKYTRVHSPRKTPTNSQKLQKTTTKLTAAPIHPSYKPSSGNSQR